MRDSPRLDSAQSSYAEIFPLKLDCLTLENGHSARPYVIGNLPERSLFFLPTNRGSRPLVTAKCLGHWFTLTEPFVLVLHFSMIIFTIASFTPGFVTCLLSEKNSVLLRSSVFPSFDFSSRLFFENSSSWAKNKKNQGSSRLCWSSRFLQQRTQ